MPADRNPSGLPSGGDPDVPSNRWTRAIDRSPTVGTAAAGFGAYMIGALLMIAAVFLIMPGLLLVVGTIGSGWQDRVGGVALMAVGAAAFVAGRWLLNGYAVQRRS